jgi:hypothetical protein
MQATYTATQIVEARKIVRDALGSIADTLTDAQVSKLLDVVSKSDL